MKYAVYLYLGILFATSLYWWVRLYLDKQHLESFLDEQKQPREEKPREKQTIETFKMKKAGDPMAGIKQLIAFFKNLTKQMKQLSPRIAYIGIGMQNTRQGLMSSTESFERGLIGGFQWFNKNVKWTEKIGHCFPLYFLSVVYYFATLPFYLIAKLVEYVLWLVTGVDFQVEVYTKLFYECLARMQKDMGIKTPEYVTKCYACDGCLSQEEIDHAMKQLAPRNFSNAKTYFRRADCAFKQAVKF